MLGGVPARAVSRKAEAASGKLDEHDDVIRWYREQLAAPAVFPWDGAKWKPVTLGPTWQVDETGHWLLPQHSTGWAMLGWTGTNLQLRGKPWRYTLEQARLILWWHGVDDSGEWLFDDGIIQRVKGWGKDPIGATECANEMNGPCRFYDFDDDGTVIATDEPDAWVQTAATALEQTKNTMRLFPGLFTAEAKARYQLQIGKETIHGHGDTRLIQAVTSSPATLEGARATFVLKNETHHWKKNNDGHEMAAVISRNAAKSEGGAARALAITNGYDPTEESVAQQDREAWEAIAAGEAVDVRIFYDSLEAAPEAPLTEEAAPDVVVGIRGDSIWLKPSRIVKEILDIRNPPATSRRFWYNQIVTPEDAWTDALKFDVLAKPDLGVGRRLLTDVTGEKITLFFDGSKSDDATVLVGCRESDGHVLTLGMWQRPPKLDAKERWTVNRLEVDIRVEQIFAAFTVEGFWADPSHVLDDETQERYWDDLIDTWHQRYKDRLKLWAIPGKTGHSVMWDMTSPARSEQFTAASMRCLQDIDDGKLTWDGDGRMRTHVHNARRYPNRWGVSLWKGHRESKRKIDLAVGMVGARMIRRELLVKERPEKPGKRAGKVW